MSADVNNLVGWQLRATYAALPDVLFSHCLPSNSPQPQLVVLNHDLALTLGLRLVEESSDRLAQLFSGNVLPPGSDPIAQAYAGHQFGHFARLGDGRAILLGEQLSPAGQLFDIQLKGAGLTPYSRSGDGRAALGPMLREFLISEGMHGLKIPTTRSLAVVKTGEPVYRTGVLPGAILTRVAQSHLRVGTFEFAATQGDDVLRALADYAIDRHYSELRAQSNPYLAFLQAIVARQAALIAQWMSVGFVHGVMNTDNMSIVGETIDYGPCAFMDRYDPSTVFSSIDQQGRYAYGNQPRIAQWNLSRLAEALLPLLADTEAEALALAQAAIGDFPGLYQSAWHSKLCQKIGIANPDRYTVQLAGELLDLMWETGADFTNTFRALTTNSLQGEKLSDWLGRWRALIDEQSGGMAEAQRLMQQVNPVVVPRNHLVQAALDQAELGDLGAFDALAQALLNPFDSALEGSLFAQAPENSTPYVTYCGT